MNRVKHSASFKAYLFLLLFSFSVRAATEDVEQKTKILTYNICSQNSLDNHSTLSSADRLPRIVKQIEEINPDVLCLQEVRRAERNSLEPRLRELGYDSYAYYRSNSKHALGLMIAYKEGKYAREDVRQWWFREDHNKCGPSQLNKYCRVLALLKVRRLADDGESPDYEKKPINIFTSHFPFRFEDQKWYALKKSICLMREYAEEGSPIVFTGDFNFFDTEGKEGPQQRAFLEENGFKNLLKNKDGSPKATFIGYSVDPYAGKTIKRQEDMGSLDGMFVANVEAEEAKALSSIDLSNLEETRDHSESDHLPCFANLFC